MKRHLPSMAISATSHGSNVLQALTVLSMLAVLVADVGARHHVCHPFSCGALSKISYPFRRQGDSPHCGPYELVCTATNATIHIGSGSYYVLSIKYNVGSFLVWLLDTNLGTQNNCPLPRWDNHALDFDHYYYLQSWAMFVNCSQEVNDHRYRPVHCLSNMDSFIYYVFSEYEEDFVYARYFKPSCGYLAMTPLDDYITDKKGARYEDVVKVMSVFREEPTNSTGIKDQIFDILYIDIDLCICVFSKQIVPFVVFCLKIMHVLYRFVLMPLAVFSFLAHKYWKTRIAIDAVEKFLQMQQMLGGPLRYAYTDIIAITSHFREKLGQGGYGSVYKGVILLGNAHVAVKMLSNSKCNGEEFISEVSTIGSIHHVNVVRLVGFCSEEMRRALVYEYMPNGSLDRYIFSSERNFSWDKLNEIALGIARGINYLHQGCDMQILHFDIKPHNILLDQNFVPKVADFGLAKLFPRDNSFVPLSAVRGTIGYIAPEMVSRSFGAISSKSDVYSFGMLLLEMAGGRKNADPNVANSSQNYYPSWVYDTLKKQQVGEVSAIVDMHVLEKKLCIVGLWCIQMRSQDRPTMSEVIEMLESNVNGLEMPSRPFFCDEGEQLPTMSSYYLSSELDVIQEEDD